jgi:predicted dehydrogenase
VTTLRIGVLGLGKMGLHHVRCAGLARGTVLAGASDVDPGRAAKLPEGVPFTTDPDELLSRVDAVVLAVPTDRHAALGRRVLAAGRHLLVEKPLAADVAQCEELARAAEAAGTVLGVGHVERWNGAMLALRDRLRRPRFVEGHRLAGFDPRGTEVDVVLDLMIHDLDLMLALYGEEPVRVEAVGVAVVSDRVDIANARLEFPGGELVNLTASRVSREPVRKLRLFQEEEYVSVDLGAQRAEVWSRDGGSPLGIGRAQVAAPPGHNPLVRELEEFAAACRGEPSGIPRAEDGRRAVALAVRILDSLRERAARWADRAAPGGASWAGAPS